MKRRTTEPSRTGIRVRHLEGRRNNQEPIEEASNEFAEEQSVQVLPQSNVQTDKLRLRIFQGMQKSSQRSEQPPPWQNQQQRTQQQQQPRMLGEYNREPQQPRQTVKIGEPVRLPDPLRLTSNQQPRPAQPPPSQQQSRSKLTIQMPNMHPTQSTTQIDSLQNFLKQPPQMREQMLQQMNPQKGNQEPIKIKPLVLYGLQKQQRQPQIKPEQPQARQIQPPNMQLLQQPLPQQPLQQQQRVTVQTPSQTSVQTPVQQQSIQEQLHLHSSGPIVIHPSPQPPQTNIIPQQQQQPPTVPGGMLVSLRDPQIKTQRASEQVDAELMKRVDSMQRQIEQLTNMLAEKDKREHLTDQRLEQIIRMKDSELQKKDSDIAKHLLRIEQLQKESEDKSKEIDALKYQLARQKGGLTSTDSVDGMAYQATRNPNILHNRQLDIRRQQQYLDEMERSKGDSLVFQQSLFKRQKQPAAPQHQPQPVQQRITSEFEVRWNSTDWNTTSSRQPEQEYLSPLAVNMNTRRPLEIDDSKRFRFEDLQDMSELEF